MKTYPALRSKPFQFFLIAALVSAVAGVVVVGQGAPALIDPDAGLKDLTAEVRQLRVAIEESTRVQSQTQALGVYLTVQQGRIMQVATRLEADRKELEGAEALSRQLTADAASLEAALPRETDPNTRRMIEMENLAKKQQLESAKFREQQIRGRESQQSQALQLEEARWSDLISRLEQIIKR